MLTPDEFSRRGLERLSTKVSRYRLLEKAAKGAFAAAAAVAVGELGIRKVAAQVGCCSSQSRSCSQVCAGGCVSGNPASICPSGWHLCTGYSGCSYCTYTSGYWGCSYGGPLYYCVDCYNGSCGSACTCTAIDCNPSPQP